MNRTFTAITSFLLCVGGLGLAVASRGAQPVPAASAAIWPIVYLTLQGSDEPPRIKCVSTDGSQVKLSVPGLGATWSPDGKWIAYVASPGELRLTNTSGETKKIFTADGTKQSILDRPMWSPDGGKIAVVVLTNSPGTPYANSLTIIDVNKAKVLGRHSFSGDVIHLPYHTSPPDKFRWSPDGKKILISWESAVAISVDKGDVETISKGPVIAEWAPDGEAVYYFEIAGAHTSTPPTLGGFYVKHLGQPPVTLVDAQGLAAAGFGITGPMYGVMALSPSGKQLALSLASDKPSLRVYDLKTGEPPVLDKPAKALPVEGAVVALEWAPDERSVAVVELGKGSEADVNIRLFDLATDQGKSLASWRLNREDIEIFTLKVISWTQ